jgi:hypothetical protein
MNMGVSGEGDSGRSTPAAVATQALSEAARQHREQLPQQQQQPSSFPSPYRMGMPTTSQLPQRSGLGMGIQMPMGMIGGQFRPPPSYHPTPTSAISFQQQQARAAQAQAQ